MEWLNEWMNVEFGMNGWMLKFVNVWMNRWWWVCQCVNEWMMMGLPMCEWMDDDGFANVWMLPMCKWMDELMMGQNDVESRMELGGERTPRTPTNSKCLDGMRGGTQLRWKWG
jgi:hypothetical protein